MPIQICPKCKTICEINESQLELGLPFECACGCKFEMFPKEGKSALGAKTVEVNDEFDSQSLTEIPRQHVFFIVFSMAALAIASLIWPSFRIISLFFVS